MDDRKPLVIFILGFPGAGKGTQCQRIGQYFGFKHLSAGDLLRDEMKMQESKHHDLITRCFEEEKIVPVEITLQLINEAMRRSEVKHFLIDGFPRNLENVAGWNEVMESEVDFRFVLMLECSRQTCEDRILERGKDSGRSHDNKESLEKRFRTYQDSSIPVADYYRKQNLIRIIDAEPSPEEVFERVKNLFQREGLSSL